MNLILACILIYILANLVLAMVLARKPKTESDYLLAGRSLGPWLATFSVFATWFGAETCIGASGEAYKHGLSGVITDPFGYALGIVLLGVFFAATLWKRGLVTMADLFRKRYGIGVERFAAIVMIPTSLLWAAAQIRAFGQVLASTSELGIFAAITLAAGVVIIYTAIGGMWADAITDLLQGIVLIVGVFALAVVLAMKGGFADLASLPAERLSIQGDRTWLETIEVFSVPVLSSIAAQELISRVLAMRSPQLARNATITAGLVYLMVGLVPVALGLVAVQHLGTSVDPEQVLSRFAKENLSLPFYILFLGALVSAILSTLSGALLVAGSLAAHNVIMPLKPNLTEATKLRLNRGAVVVFGVLSYLIALSSESVYSLVQESAALGSSGILVAMMFALWGERIGAAASAYGALIASLSAYVIGSYFYAFTYPYLTSLAAALLAYVLLIPFKQKRAQPAAA